MKPGSPQRPIKPQSVRPRAKSKASEILARDTGNPFDIFTRSPQAVIAAATVVAAWLISWWFTGLTHQLDEIKNVMLMVLMTPILFATVYFTDFRRFSWKTDAPTLLLGLFFVNMVFSFLINPYKIVGERVVWFMTISATFTIAFGWLLQSEKAVYRVLKSFVILLFTSTVLGLLMYSGRFTSDAFEETMSRLTGDLGTLIYTLYMSRNDMMSFILNPDFYAAFLVMLMYLPLSMFLAEEKIQWRLFGFITFLLSLVCLLFTNSNDSNLALLFSIPFYIVLLAMNLKSLNISRRFLWSAIGSIVFLAIFCVAIRWPTYARTWEFKAAAFGGRQVLWGGGFWPWLYGDDSTLRNLDPISIIFGVGPGGYRHYFSWFRRPDFFDQQINNVTTFGHNWYLDLLLETGLIGLTLFLAFKMRIMVEGVRQIVRTTSRKHLLYQAALMAGMVNIAVQNYSSPNNRWAVASITFWTIFGLSMALTRLDTPSEPPAEERKVGNYPLHKLIRYAALAFAFVGFIRCFGIPGTDMTGQGWKYWTAARAHNLGLRFMNSAEGGRDPLNYQRAVTAFETAIRTNPTFASSYYKLGHVYNTLSYESQGDDYLKYALRDKALDTYKRLNEINPSYSEVNQNLGVMYQMKAVTLPDRLKAYKDEQVKLAKELKAATPGETARIEKQIEELGENVANLEKNLPAEQQKIREIAYQHAREAAHQSWKPLAQNQAANQALELATIAYEADDEKTYLRYLNEAKEYYRVLVEYEPKLPELIEDKEKYYPTALAKLYSLAMGTDNVDEALRYLKLLIKHNPDNDEYMVKLIALLDEENRTQEKIEFLKEAVRDEPTDTDLRLFLADSYRDAKDMENFENELRRSERLKPDSVVALKSLHQHYLATGSSEKATEYAGKLTALGITPDTVSTSSTSAISDTTAPASAETTASATPVTQPQTTTTE